MKARRQGDVYLISVDDFPSGVNLQKLNHTILAEGEVTGHFHEVQGKSVLYEVDEREMGKVLVEKYGFREQDVVGVRGLLDVQADEVTLTHQEHGAQTLTKGKYIVGIQHEYEPEGWRRVVD